MCSKKTCNFGVLSSNTNCIMTKKFIFKVLLLVFFFSSCHTARFFYYNFADVNDYKKFPQITINNSPDFIFTFHKGEQSKDFGNIILPEKMSEKSSTIDQYHKETGTTAFLIVRNDSIFHENYFGGNEDKILTSFSVVKSFIAALIGIAVDEGKIKSTTEPMTNYIDYWGDKTEFSKITIDHLLDMKSGIIYTENYYNPFGDVAKYYYGRHLERYLKNVRIGKEAGKEYDYVSVNTLLLSLILEKATGVTTEEYMQEKLWKPLGMEFSATMNRDRKNGTAKAFTGLNARLRDYAKFGRLYLHWGEWEGNQLISRSWIERLRNQRPQEGDRLLYADQWRISKSGDFAAIGHLGQYIYVYPQKNIIIVRTGKKSGRWLQLLHYISSEIQF
jgi:CubicO group peptidase (beta-lactamase class C family)